MGEITRSTRYLNMELTCPVCLRILHKTEIVMECLHRFCSECIQKCLRVGKNECPSCRIHVPSRRSLRPDPNFDALIAKIYPDLHAFERYEEKMIQQFNKSRAELQVVRPPKRPRPPPRAPPQTTTATPKRARPAPERRAKPQANTVNFVLRVHPHETGVKGLAREYLSTSDQLKVMHLKKFLGLKLKYKPIDDFELLIALEDQCVVLNDHLSLAQILNTFANDNDVEIILHYRLARPTGI